MIPSHLIRRSSQKSDQSAESPPAYDSKTERGDQTNEGSSFVTTGIEAKHAPQWKWKPAECQEWLRATFIEHLDKTPEEATRLALKIKGAGPAIYIRRRYEWIQQLGEGDGITLYAIIIGKRSKRGAVPWWMNLNH